MEIPKWLRLYIQKDQLQKIEEAVEKAEKKTSGEIVPMVVHRSSTVGHVTPLLFSLLALLIYVSDLPVYQSQWLNLSNYLWIAIDLALAAAIAYMLTPFAITQRLLTSKRDQEFQVLQRAMNEFYNFRVHHTEKSTGILIFVSMMEHKAIVLGDDPIAEKMEQKTWQKAVELLIAGMKKKDLAQGFCDAIDFSGELLAEHFPIQENDKDELKNHLVIKE